MRDEPKKLNLQSVTSRDHVSDFLYTVELTQQRFEGVKGKTLKSDGMVIMQTNKLSKTQEQQDRDFLAGIRFLRIPRKPDWHKKDAETQRKEEVESFVQWRRDLSELESRFPNCVITPYEKNFEVWKQLWHVVERSDVLVQIVDVRDFAFFRCEDLEEYVKSVSPLKQNFLVLNKSDLMPENLINCISKTLNQKNINHVFFSAKTQLEKIEANLPDDEVVESVPISTPKILNRKEMLFLFDKLAKDMRALKNPQEEAKEPVDVDPHPQVQTADKVQDEAQHQPKPDEAAENAPKLEEKAEPKDGEARQPDGDKQPKEESKGPEKHAQAPGNHKPSSSHHKPTERQHKDHKRHHDDQNLDEEHEILKHLSKPKIDPNMITIGMVGYPNVGKSSLINSLIGKKKVSVDCMPGKTKNFQTLLLKPDLMLCDCPGLVFPSIVASKAKMVNNGVLNVENLVEHIAPIEHLLSVVPAQLLIELYHLPLKVPNAEAQKAASNESEKELGPNLLEMNPKIDHSHTKIDESCVNLDYKINTREFLQLYAGTRGFVTGSALPDEAKAAKQIIRDVVSGKVPYFILPKEYEQEARAVFKKLVIDYYSPVKISIKNVKKQDLLMEEKRMGIEKNQQAMLEMEEHEQRKLQVG